jgi:uncharacterized damage-inducible protein DinB
MQSVELQISAFQREYLAEIVIVQTNLLALAKAVPEDSYGWRPAKDARSFSEILVHIAVAHYSLLHRAGVRAHEVMDMYGDLEGSLAAQLVAAIRKNIAMEKDITGKAEVIDLLKHSFGAVTQAFTTASDEQFETALHFLDQETTVRRVYLRILAHSHEHMGQAVAYARCMGYKVPWPDPLDKLELLAAAGDSRS